MSSHNLTSGFHAERSRGFTLIELMVAMGIIVILLGLGTIAFNTLTGNRSVELAQNQVAAALGRARAMAINAPETGAGADADASAYGVAFFLDPQTDRTALMFVRRAPQATGDPDPYDNYKGWVPGVSYQIGDRCVAIVRDDAEGGKPMARRFRCIASHGPSDRAVNGPQRSGPPFSNGYWAEITGDGGTIVLNEPVELLPKGVGVQTMVDVTGTTGFYDRFLRTGVILFNRQGRLESLTYAFDEDSPLAQRMNVGWTIGDGNAPIPVLRSQFGLIIYDTEQFRGDEQRSEYDVNGYSWQQGQTPADTPSNANETAEETWLENNGTFLMVNRYSGELTRVR